MSNGQHHAEYHERGTVDSAASSGNACRFARECARCCPAGLAAEGFEALDQGPGITRRGEAERAEFIGEIGRRAAIYRDAARRKSCEVA